MGKFKKIEEKLLQVVSFLLEEDELVKLLANVETIDDTVKRSLINKNIYKYPYIPDIQEETKSIICCFVTSIEINEKNPKFFNGVLNVIIMVHKNLINTDLGDRLLNLCDIVDEKLEKNRELGIGGADFGRVEFLQPNLNFLAYRMPYKIINWKV